MELHGTQWNSMELHGPPLLSRVCRMCCLVLPFLDAFPVEFCIRDFGIGFYTSLATRAWADMPEGRPPRDLRHCS